MYQAGLRESSVEYDERADVFSFAIFMYTLAAKTPFPYESLYLIPQQVVEAVALRGLRPPLSPSFRLEPAYVDLVERCWAADPDDRPSMDTVALTLHSLVESRNRAETLAGKNSGSRQTIGSFPVWGSWFGQ